MFFQVGVLDFILWCIQELGVLLSVGAAAAVLVGYLVALRDHVLTEKEARYSKRVHLVLSIGLACMLLSGVAIVVLHASLGQWGILLAPVFVFKWLLIAVLVCAYSALWKKPYAHFLLEGAIGGTWAALFLIHTVAPAVSWMYLFILYALVLGGFMLVWSALVKLTQEKQAPASRAPQPSPKPAAVAPTPAPKVAMPPRPVPPPPKPTVAPAPIPKPVAPAVTAPLPAIAKPAPVAPSVAPPPAPASVAMVQAPVKKESEPPKPDDPHHSPWLPAIHVMPKDVAQLEDRSHITPLAAVTKNT